MRTALRMGLTTGTSTPLTFPPHLPSVAQAVYKNGESEDGADMVTAYNGLLSVEDASDQLLGNSGLADFLVEFVLLAHMAHASKYVGAVLLHRHFDLAVGQEICEVPIVDQFGAALLSSPSVRGRDQLPHRWRLAGDGWMPLEYSSDPAVARYQAEANRFMTPFARLVLRYGLEPLIGLAITPRDALTCTAGEVFFEETITKASVVRCVAESESDQLFINTLWAPDVTSPYLRCHQTQRCRREGSPPDDRHSYLHGHDSESG